MHGWIQLLFLDWFHNTFVPFIQQELLNLGLEPRALLTLDNCSAHPDPELLVSKDKNDYHTVFTHKCDITDPTHGLRGNTSS